MCVCVCCVAAVQGRARVCVWGGGVVWGGGAGRDVSVCGWACMCGVWAETEAERHSQAKDNAVCVCRGCVCVCGGEAVCGVLCGMWGRVRVCCGGGGGEGWGGVWCIGATRGRVRHMGVCVAAETEAGRPSQAKDNAVCVCPGVCVCVCVWRAVCVCVGGYACGVWAETQASYHTARQRTALCVRPRVCVCVRAHAYVRGVGRVSVCWGGGGVRRCVACL